jgi:trehalose synthase
MFEVAIATRDPGPLRTIGGADGREPYEGLMRRARAMLHGRTLWHVNATAEGGGVAELLNSTLGYLRGDEIETRWLVFEADAPFFEITKRIHNRLHGDLGDGGPLGDSERRHYDATTARELAGISRLVRSGDVVVVHDPQPVGLVPSLRALGATVVWTCHVGQEVPNLITRSAWAFLREDVRAANAVTFTRSAYAWEGLDGTGVHVIPPCIDPFSLKNVGMEPDHVREILMATGLVAGPSSSRVVFVRADGSEAPILHGAEMTEQTPVPRDAPLVVQVSRWDALKDPIGVMSGFAEAPELADAHLILAGPAPSSVADDPEAERVLRSVRRRWADLRGEARGRVHLANLSTADIEENAIIVNALQRRADVVVQKSLAEGFGLTVTEAMWKARPVVAANVGGIRDQIEDGVSGVLVDPRYSASFAVAVADVLGDPRRAEALGIAARRRVRGRYLPPRYLGAYLELFLRLSDRRPLDLSRRRRK